MAVMVLLWGIWLALSITSGSLDYVWPIFPTLGMGVPVMIAFFRHILDVAND